VPAVEIAFCNLRRIFNPLSREPAQRGPRFETKKFSLKIITAANFPDSFARRWGSCPVLGGVSFGGLINVVYIARMQINVRRESNKSEELETNNV
jgi:hypothetical protein